MNKSAISYFRICSHLLRKFLMENFIFYEAQHAGTCRHYPISPYALPWYKVTNQMKSCFYMQVTGKSYCSLQKSSIKKIAISSVF